MASVPPGVGDAGIDVETSNDVFEVEDAPQADAEGVRAYARTEQENPVPVTEKVEVAPTAMLYALVKNLAGWQLGSATLATEATLNAVAEAVNKELMSAHPLRAGANARETGLVVIEFPLQ